MYLNRYKFTRMKDHFQVKDRKKNIIEILPLNFDNLSEKQKKAIKKSMIFSKIISPIFLPILTLVYNNYLALLIYIIAIIIYKNIFGVSNYLFWFWEIIIYVLQLTAIIIFILQWAKRWYNAKAYYILKKAYENK